MIAEYVPSDHQNDNFYERFMEQRVRDLKNPSTTEEHDSFPFPIEPLRSIPSNLKSDLVRKVTIQKLLPHLLFLAPLYSHLHFLFKHQPPSIFLSVSTNCSNVASGTSQSDSTIFS